MTVGIERLRTLRLNDIVFGLCHDCGVDACDVKGIFMADDNAKFFRSN